MVIDGLFELFGVFLSFEIFHSKSDEFGKTFIIIKTIIKRQSPKL